MPPKKTEEQLLPTPPVCWPVQWIKEGADNQTNDDMVAAAIVTNAEAPGRVELMIVEGKRQPAFYKSGVRHVSDPQWDKPTHADRKAGAWRYAHGLENPDKLKVAQDFKARQEEARRNAEKQKMEQAARRQRANDREQAELAAKV